MRLGALEAGGTKMVCAIGLEDGTVLDQVSIQTTTPEETLPKIISYFNEKKIDALGVGSFGPIDINQNSNTYGFILDTPKLAWRQYDLVGNLKKELNVPMGFDTDVNASCLGEMTFGCAKALENVIYITIGTGIGVGICINHTLVHGMLHPEAGHILMDVHPQDSFKGSCPYHGNCFEGMAAGPAIEKRWGKKAIELSGQMQVWELEAYYIAQAIVSYIMIVSPQKIILGGGVMHQLQLFPLIRRFVLELMNGYIRTKELSNIDEYIVPASLGDDQGIMGCLELARKAIS
ncbi:MAG: ROK family protein [Clostridia bacterium]|nr:ROK family protein [Clostridia bacterium]